MKGLIAVFLQTSNSDHQYLSESFAWLEYNGCCMAMHAWFNKQQVIKAIKRVMVQIAPNDAFFSQKICVKGILKIPCLET